MTKPIDDAVRKLAVSGQDRNIVVTAGAGTGKTTLLVNRMLHLLLGHKRFHAEESPIQKVAAMTFTEKAANDMKMKLLEELERIAAVISGYAPEDEKTRVEEFLAGIRDTYQIPYSEIERRARKSLEDMDKAVIGTIHSFASYILRLYLVESGVVPGFVVDEGDVFDELFDKEWTKWLDTELTLTSPHAAVWKVVLRRLDLESLRVLTKRLSGFTIPLKSLTEDKDASYGSLIDPVCNDMLKIIPSCEKPGNNLVSQLQELLRIFDTVKEHGIGYLKDVEYDVDKKASGAKAGWKEEEFGTAQRLVKESHTLLKKLKAVDTEFVKTVIDLLLPFAANFRETYLSQGYVSFDGLLTLTRDLLRNSEYRYVRDRLKSEFRAILVDEFQDTDPVQYEIVLFLSEAPGHYSTEARRVVLEPGKLFIVGDPKQSIYAFRRADIEAYEQVVKQVCGQDDVLKLQENFRSHSGIIGVVNQLFDGRIMIEQQGLQPCYIPIHANRPKTHLSQKVEIVLVSGKEGEELMADEGREAESAWIARWITEQVQNGLMRDTAAKNGTRKLNYRDIVLLLRAFTQVRPYVEALKRHNIPYIVEGEKYFYTTQEVLDFMNLLRTIENPHDTIPLVGILRSPVVGLTDREIYELRRNNLLDYRKNISGEVLNEDLNRLDCITVVKEFYNLLRKFHARAGILPVTRLITEIIDNTYIAEITAAAWHGEQKLANLRKLYQIACDMEQSKGVSLKTFIDCITTRIKEAREEGESPLSDETLDVVKILTIHKSKGLEFPVVILANLHGEVRADNEALDSAVFDWSTSTTGIVIGKGSQQVRNLWSIVIEKKLNDRSWEEEKRVLYVAMTRAKERLILTGLLKNDDKSYMGLLTQAVREASGVELDNETCMSQIPGQEEENVSPSSKEMNEICEGKSSLPLQETDRVGGIVRGKFSLGNAEIFVEHFKFDGVRRPLKFQKGEDWNVNWPSIAEIWRKRRQAMIETTRTPVFISPTSLSEEESTRYDPPSVRNRMEKTVEGHLHNALLIGSICHSLLKEWDFHGTKEELRESIESAMRWIFTAQNDNLNLISTDPARPSSALSGEGDIKISINPSFLSLREEYRGMMPESVYTLKIQDFEFIKAEVMKILLDFIDSEAYKELQDAEILGREVPFLLHWNGQIMRGVIDILYKTDNRIFIAEYKTDHIDMADLLPAGETSVLKNNEHANISNSSLDKIMRYRRQKEVYIEAVKRCLNEENPEFRFIFLRLGKAVSL